MNDKNEVLIQVQDLKKAFGKLEVLRGISTEIKKGEVVVVIGPSGSGKSTFLRSLNLLEVPTGREKSKRTAAEGWTCRQGRCISGSAFRWTETAYCDRAVSGNESGCDVVR